MVYDLLPLQLPDCFYEVGQENHRRWLEVVAESDLAICISKAVADDLRKWFEGQGVESMPRIEYAHLGADIGKQIASQGMLLHCCIVLGIDDFACTQTLRVSSLVGTSGEYNHIRAKGGRKFHSHVTESA